MYEYTNLKKFIRRMAARNGIRKFVVIRNSYAQGTLLVSILVVTGLFVTLGMLALQFVITQNSASRFRVDRERAFQIAEAGVEYYRWHLAHVPGDFQDGTGGVGPYVHTYKDVTGNVIGTYTLDITPPAAGSTIVTIKSTGQVTNRTTSARTVVTQEGVPSFTQWAVVANAAMRFGVGTEVFGPIHSNGGIRFDGLAHNIITSYLQTYTDVDSDRCTANSWAVHTCVNPDDPSPMTALPNRTDVFAAGRRVLADYVDFNNITTNLQTLETKASANGILLLPSGGQGYHLTFRLDGKVDMRIVNTQLTCQYNSGGTWKDYGYCSNNSYKACTQMSTCNYCSGNSDLVCSSNPDCSSQGAGTCVTSGFSCLIASKSIGTRVSDQSAFTYKTAPSLGVSLPANGIFFVQDDLWVDGVVPNGTRLTIVAAKEPLASGIANIYMNKDLTYARACSNTNLACSLDSECTGGATCVTASNGTSAVGLISQQDIFVGYFGEDDLRIDAALIAQKGHVGRPNYGASGTSYQLSPTIGFCQNSPTTVCTVSSNCPTGSNRNCLFTPLTGYCSNNSARACTTDAGCTGGGVCIISKNPAGGTTCQEYRSRNHITTFGSIATNQRYGFALTGSTFCGGTQSSGYCNRTLNFDGKLMYAPPPDFPTTGQYTTLSWEEQ